MGYRVRIFSLKKITSTKAGHGDLPEISVLRRLKQEDGEFEVSLSYIASSKAA